METRHLRRLTGHQRRQQQQQQPTHVRQAGAEPHMLPAERSRLCHQRLHAAVGRITARSSTSELPASPRRTAAPCGHRVRRLVVSLSLSRRRQPALSVCVFIFSYIYCL